MVISKENILTTGAGGMLGSYVDFGVRMTHKSLDVRDLNNVRAVFQEHKPSVVLHLAAEVDLNKCEADPIHAYQTNVVGTYNVALVAREIGALMVYVSTAGVFDGKKGSSYLEKDIPNPLNYYGHSKYLGELAVAGISNNHIIARAGWMFGGGPDKDHKFVSQIIGQLNKTNIEVVGGKSGTLIYAKDFINELLQLVDSRKTGIFHIGNKGVATRVDVAREIVRITNASTEIVEVDTKQLTNFKSTFLSGKNESMDSNTISLRPWQEALEEYIHTEWKE